MAEPCRTVWAATARTMRSQKIAEVEKVPGFRDGIMGRDLMDHMRAQAERFGAQLVTDDVTAVDLTGEVKTVTVGEGNVHRAKAVILSMGSAYRELGLPREKELSGSSATRTSRSAAAGRGPPAQPGSQSWSRSWWRSRRTRRPAPSAPPRAPAAPSPPRR